MTGELANLKLRRIFVLRTSLLGLIAGLLLGAFLALVLILVSFFGLNGISYQGIDVGKMAFEMAVNLAVILVLASAILGFIFVFLSCLLYNLFSWLGLNVRFQIEDIGLSNKEQVKVATQTQKTL